jgi:multidrug efflux pump
MYLFLQKVRYTLIPAIVAPIALLGTLAVMLLAGFSINVLTMFGMVLAIGIIVDDAIVVVENVERIMHQEHLSPGGHTQGNARDHRRRDRHYRRAHRGIPAHGVFQRFGRCDLSPVHADDGRIDPVLRLPRPVADSSADLLLCSPITGEERKNRFFTWFDDRFERMTAGYERWVVAILKRTGAPCSSSRQRSVWLRWLS